MQPSAHHLLSDLRLYFGTAGLILEFGSFTFFQTVPAANALCIMPAVQALAGGDSAMAMQGLQLGLLHRLDGRLYDYKASSSCWLCLSNALPEVCLPAAS